MKYLIDNSPHIDAKYRSNDGKTFIITDLPQKENDPWVVFENVKTKDSYNCRLEAFLARYSPLPD